MTDDTILTSTDEAAHAIAALREATPQASDQQQSMQDKEPANEIDDAAEGAAAEPDEDDAPDPASGEQEEEGEPERAPVTAMPTSWPKDRIEEWNALTPSARDVILAREEEVQTAISDKGREAAEARRQAAAETNRVTTQYQDRINRLNHLLPSLTQNFQSKYEAVDWVKLANEDPENYTRLRTQAEVEHNQIQAAKAETHQAQAQQHAAFQAAQYKTLLARNPQYQTAEGRQALVAEAKEVEAFALSLEGVTADQLHQLSAPVYEALRDAMKYRKASKTATRPAKEPAQRVLKPGARRTATEAAKKTQSEAKAKIKALAKAGAGRNAQTAAFADALAAKRRTK